MKSEHADVIAGIEARRKELCEAVVKLQYARQRGKWERYGQRGWNLSVRDQDHHLTYLLEAISETDTSLFANYVGWLKQLFEGLKLPDKALEVMLECTQEVLRQRFSKEITFVTDESLEAGLTHLQSAAGRHVSFIADDNPLRDLATVYLNALLKGERHVASKQVLDAVGSGASAKDIYLYVFQPCQCTPRSVNSSVR